MAIRSNPTTEHAGPRLRRRFRKGVFVVPSLLTTANIFCGFYSVMESMAGMSALGVGDPAAAADHFNRAAINIGVAVLFDLLDGRIARMTGATSEFGIELDSLADVLSFGVAPAVLAYAWGYGQFAELHKLGWGVSFLFLLCGTLRLARFNVQARRPNPDLPPKNLKADKKAFVGLPIPAAASLIAAIVHFTPAPLTSGAPYMIDVGDSGIGLDGRALAGGLLLLVVGLAMLMVSTIRYTSFKAVGNNGNARSRRIILLMALVGLAIWAYSEWTLLILASFYAAHGVVGKLLGMLRPRRASETADLELDHKPHG